MQGSKCDHARRFVALAVLATTGCATVLDIEEGTLGPGSDGGTSPETASTTDAGATARPPARPATSGSGGATRWFALRTLQLSDPGEGSLGYDLDLRKTMTDADLGEVCKGGSHRDGVGGRDNAFGRTIMPAIRGLQPSFEADANAEITAGRSTLLLRLDNVGAADNAKVPGALFLAGPHAGPPTFTASDRWPIDRSSVSADFMAKASFPDGYMASGVWISGDSGKVSSLVHLPFAGKAGVPVTLTLESTVISVRVNDGTEGRMAGASTIARLEASVTPLLKAWGVCPGSAYYDTAVGVLRQSADLVAGAPQLQDPARPCDAVSIGVGFTMAATGAPSSHVTVTPPTSSCP